MPHPLPSGGLLTHRPHGAKKKEQANQQQQDDNSGNGSHLIPPRK
jgi:hypothetical protein